MLLLGDHPLPTQSELSRSQVSQGSRGKRASPPSFKPAPAPGPLNFDTPCPSLALVSTADLAHRPPVSQLDLRSHPRLLLNHSLSVLHLSPHCSGIPLCLLASSLISSLRLAAREIPLPTAPSAPH